MEAHMTQHLALIAIPPDLSFSDLRLARDPDGDVSFDWTPIERICEASGLPPNILRTQDEDAVSALIVAWYQVHRRAGGEPDPVAEDLIAEATAEEKAGQTVSHQPGRA